MKMQFYLVSHKQFQQKAIAIVNGDNWNWLMYTDNNKNVFIKAPKTWSGRPFQKINVIHNFWDIVKIYDTIEGIMADHFELFL